jgi:acyl-coenzyme A thioesterase PaaI-like protein
MFTRTGSSLPAARTQGWELIAANPGAGTIEVAFTATDAVTTPFGHVLGGSLAAMLYDTVGPALLATLAPDQFLSTLDLHTMFVGKTTPGRLLGRGRIVRRTGDIAFLDASLTGSNGALVATATATAKVIAAAARAR